MHKQWPAAQRLYTDYAQHIQQVHDQYLSRVSQSLWLWQFGDNPQSLISASGHIQLTRQQRKHLLYENRYLARIHERWLIWEERFTNYLLPKHLDTLANALAQRSQSDQLAYGLAFFWDQRLSHYYPIYQQASPEQQRQLVMEISTEFEHVSTPYAYYIDCSLKFSGTIQELSLIHI